MFWFFDFFFFFPPPSSQKLRHNQTPSEVFIEMFAFSEEHLGTSMILGGGWEQHTSENGMDYFLGM